MKTLDEAVKNIVLFLGLQVQFTLIVKNSSDLDSVWI